MAIKSFHLGTIISEMIRSILFSFSFFFVKNFIIIIITINEMKWINNTARQKRYKYLNGHKRHFLFVVVSGSKIDDDEIKWIYSRKKNDSRDQENHNKKNENLNFSKITIIHLLPSSYTNNDDPQMILIGFFSLSFSPFTCRADKKKNPIIIIIENQKKRKWKIMGNSQRWHFELRWQQKQFKKWRKKDWNNG